jgi:hypothetical protein
MRTSLAEGFRMTIEYISAPGVFPAADFAARPAAGKGA